MTTSIELDPIISFKIARSSFLIKPEECIIDDSLIINPLDVVYVEKNVSIVNLRNRNMNINGYRVFMFRSVFDRLIGSKINELYLAQKAFELTINYFGINKRGMYRIGSMRNHDECFYCGANNCPMTTDHVVPVRVLKKHGLIPKGSRSVGLIDNAVRCCGKCNLAKESKSIHSWKIQLSLIRLHNDRSFDIYWRDQVLSTLNNITDGSNIFLYPQSWPKFKRPVKGAH